MMESNQLPLLVVGGGIAGMSAAVEAAEAGSEVVLVERDPSVGGRVARSHQYFPKLCPPSCGLEINIRRIERNPRIRVITQATVSASERTASGWSVTVSKAPAYVNDRCTICGDCAEACPGRVQDPHNLGMNEVTAIRLPFANAWPRRFVLDREACPEGCTACVEACSYGAIDLAAEETRETLDVSAVVIATGWSPYPIESLPELGGGLYEDVVSNAQMERLAAKGGPTGGKIVRPSDGEAPRSVAFLQCAGSRDVNHLPYCSAVCCLASLKQALYVREQLPEAAVTIYYIDRRAPGRNEDLLTKVAETDGVRLVKGKVGKVEKAEDGDLRLRVEDVEAGRIVTESAELVVLATGMVPNLKSLDPPVSAERDEDGFAFADLTQGVMVAGVAHRPVDVATSVRDATAAAARASMAARKGA
jgi:quinone-modifying oxidoreductase subunit QmoA